MRPISSHSAAANSVSFPCSNPTEVANNRKVSVSASEPRAMLTKCVVLPRATAVTFGDVGSNGGCRSQHLARQSILLCLRHQLRQPVDLRSKLHRLLPHKQVSMRFNRHATPFPS